MLIFKYPSTGNDKSLCEFLIHNYPKVSLSSSQSYKIQDDRQLLS